MNETDRVAREAPARETPARETPARETPGGRDYELGKLNRHWYQRCMDRLDDDLRRSGGNPSVTELKELCDRVLTGFLTAVTGQAPFSPRLQFPADRAYFIPFEGDNAGRFNFSKPFYRFLSGPSGLPKNYEDSIWSFCPWTPDAAGVQIVDSLDGNQFTINFGEMISVREASRQGEHEGSGADPHELRLKKSLFLRKDLLGETARAADEGPTLTREVESRDGGLEEMLRPRDDGTEQAKKKTAAAREFREQLDRDVEDSLVALFEIYRKTPGNVGIEVLLRNHLHLLNYLSSLPRPGSGDDGGEAGVTAAKARGRGRVSQNKEAARALFRRFLGIYFGTGRGETRNALLVGLRENKPQCKDADGREAWYDDAALKELLEAGQSPFWEMAQESHDGLGEERIEKALDAVIPRLRNFGQDFLHRERDEQLEMILKDLLGEEFLRAGDSQQSFVWVCPDFESVLESLQSTCQKVFGEESVVQVQKYSGQLTKAYTTFFRRLDAVSVEKESSRRALDAYWQTRGDRVERLFATSTHDEAGMCLPEGIPPVREFHGQFLEHSRARNQSHDWSPFDDPRPQSIFLRVCIRDSLNEPMIDGLFVFSTDYDEGRTTDKSRDRRFEDVEDLLAFGKVYFFAVREYFHGLDLAREAREIGELNQHLYNKRLAGLDALITERSKRLRRAITDDEAWGPFIYAVLNNYASSLVDTTKRTRIETFPYDRLLIIPLASRTEDAEFDLPFYLFQAVFVERVDGRIHPRRYSLVKPYQSPVEKLEDAGEQSEGVAEEWRFTQRSFQQESVDDSGTTTPLDQFLEKHYVGAGDPPAGSGGAAAGERADENKCESNVPKLVSGAGGRPDRGRLWVRNVLCAFWSRTRRDKDLWVEFLTRMTRDIARVRTRDVLTEESRQAHHWFWLRVGLLRLILGHLCEGESGSALRDVLDSYPGTPHPDGVAAGDTDPAALSAILRHYDETLRLEFDDNKAENIIVFAQQNEPDLFKVLKDSLKGAPDDVATSDELKDLKFVSYRLGAEDPFVLLFLEELTRQVANRRKGEGEDAAAETTWYQPLLTRPLTAADAPAAGGPAGPAGRATDAALARTVGRRIKERVPQYEAMRRGNDGAQTFLGVINLRVSGGSERDQRRMSYLVAMIRDFDERRTNRFRSDAEAEEQEKIDRRDLALYTATFFRNLRNAVDKTIREQQLGVFSRDISQIARNWYSSGTDAIVGALQQKIQALAANPQTKHDLGRLRPEVMDCFFDELLKVMVRLESRADGAEPIKLESFPFDRLLHIPLWGAPSDTPSDGARLCYSRTTVKNITPEQQVNWEPKAAQGPRSQATYGVIRKFGRVWDMKGGQKKVAPEASLHLGPDPARDAAGEPARDLFAAGTALGKALRQLSGVDKDEAGFIHGFVPRLYEAKPLQSLAQAGLVCHLLQRMSLTAPGKRHRGLRQAALRLWEVVADRIRSLERGATEAVLTKVEAQPLVLKPWPEKQGNVRPASADLLLFRELFQQAEGDEWVYGMLPDTSSKVFYVYYSIKAPETFKETQGNDRYRGVVCLILDDARVDQKPTDQESADREDLHTLVHNSVGGLKLVLELQALLGRVHQPGAEDAITGTLHRLKNALGVPLTTLGSVKELLKPLVRAEPPAGGAQPAPGPTPEKVKDLYEQVQEAEAVIDGIQELFKQMQNVSAPGEESLHLETLSSDWLGWLFVGKLCEAAKAVLDALTPKGGDGPSVPAAKDEIREVRKEIDAVARRAAARYNPEENWSELTSESFAEPEKVQGELLLIQAGLERAFRAHAGGKAFKLFLSYHVYAPHRLYFQGSRRIVEALNILIENAFQAFCSFVRQDDGDGQGRLGLVCRPGEPAPGEHAPGEVLLEIRNSSVPIEEEMYKHLVAPVAMPMTAARHARGSGKKGGSGFGHYYARRVISSFCGGQKWRRQLEVGVDQVNEEGLVCVRVNLLEPDPTRSREQHRDHIRAAVEKVFPRALASLPPLPDGPSFYLPEDPTLEDFLELVRDLLAAARAAEVHRMSLELQTVADYIKDNTQRFRRQLGHAFRLRAAALTGADGAGRRQRLERLVRELSDKQGLPPESFQALRGWLLRLDKNDRDLLQELAQGGDEFWAPPDTESGENAVDADSRDRLRRFLGRAWQAPVDVLSPEEQANLRARLAPFTPHLRRPADTPDGFGDCLRKTFHTDAAADPGLPVLEAVEEEFKPEAWSVRLEASGESLTLTVRLSEYEPADGLVAEDRRDAAPRAEQPGETEVVTEQALKRYFTVNKVGRKFLKYRRAFQALAKKKALREPPEFRRFPRQGAGAEGGQEPFWEVRLVLQAVSGAAP